MRYCFFTHLFQEELNKIVQPVKIQKIILCRCKLLCLLDEFYDQAFELQQKACAVRKNGTSDAFELLISY